MNMTPYKIKGTYKLTSLRHLWFFIQQQFLYMKKKNCLTLQTKAHGIKIKINVGEKEEEEKKGSPSNIE